MSAIGAMRIALQARDYEILTLFLSMCILSAREIYALVAEKFEQPKDLKPYSFDHPLLLARFLTCATLAVQKTPGIEIKELYPEGAFYDFVTFFDGKNEITLPIKPDATLVLEDSRDDVHERLAIFHEAQRRTMPLRRATFTQSSFHKKTTAYLHYWLQGARLREHLGVEDFIVLTVCEDEAARIALTDFAQNADEEQRGTNLFWFVTKAALDSGRGGEGLSDFLTFCLSSSKSLRRTTWAAGRPVPTGGGKGRSLPPSSFSAMVRAAEELQERRGGVAMIASSDWRQPYDLAYQIMRGWNSSVLELRDGALFSFLL